MAPSAIVVVPTLSEVKMEALQITGMVSLGSVAFLSLLYSEIVLLHKS